MGRPTPWLSAPAGTAAERRAAEAEAEAARVKAYNKSLADAGYDVPKTMYEGVVAAKAGDRVLVDIFSEARFVDVIGTSKGRGFAGVVRRHHFGGGPKSHGHMFQVQGSIGASSYPSRVFPGQRMPGHMGAEQVTVRNLRIRGIDPEENLLMVEGAVPGSREGYVLISKAKTPPRERRGFAGSGTVDPLKASKKAGGKRK